MLYSERINGFHDDIMNAHRRPSDRRPGLKSYSIEICLSFGRAVDAGLHPAHSIEHNVSNANRVYPEMP